jgi:hypothetical protein
MRMREVAYTVASLPMQAGIPTEPPPTPTPLITLSAASPASGPVNAQSNPMTVAWANLPAAITITPNVSPGPGNLDPTFINAGPGSGSASLRLTPLAAAVHQVSLINNGGIPNPQPVLYTATTVFAPSLTWEAPNPATGNVGAASGNFRATLVNGVTAVVVTPSSTLAGLWTPTTRTLTVGAPTATFVFTPSAIGSHGISLANDASITPPPAVTYAATAVGATAFVLSAPGTGLNNVAATVTVTPNGAVTGGAVVTLSANNGGVLGVTTLTFSPGATLAQSTTITRAADGASVITMTNSAGLINTGSGATFTSSSAGTLPEPPTTGFVTLEIRPTATVAKAAVATGHTFRKGAVPAGSQLVNVQMVVKNTWADGSAKIASLAFGCAVTGTTPRTVGLTIGAGPSGPALTLAALKATGITAAMSAGPFGSASWSGTDWDSPFEAWITGPLMSSWVFRKPIGSDAHLVVWLEVRLFANGAVEVLPWIENGYLNVPGPTNKNATYIFTLGGTQRESIAVDFKHHQRSPIITGAKLAHWLGADPGVTPVHDAAYLQSAELVPTYVARLPLGDPVIYTGVSAGGKITPPIPATFTPLQQGNYWFGLNGQPDDSMTNTGYQEPLGLLMQADVLHLIAAEADRARTYGGVVRNGYSAGRYGLHYRDETTNRPASMTAYPTLVLRDDGSMQDTGIGGTTTPATSGGNPIKWDTAHSPSVGYLAYLLTARFYFKEQVQFAAIADHLNVTDWVRGGGYNPPYIPQAGYSGADSIWVSFPQTRSGSWRTRSLTQAAAVTPDVGDPNRTPLLSAIEANCRFWSQIYLEQTNNVFGFIEGGGSYQPGTGGFIPGAYGEPVWEQDFGTAAWGQAIAMELPISAPALTKMKAFFAWKARSIVGRLGLQADYWYINAAPYALPIARSPSADFRGGTGPWYASWAAIYSALVSTPGSEPVSLGGVGTTEGVLALSDFPSSVSPNMWHNLQPAISYAVRHAVPGALAAYNRMTQASNWSAIVASWVAHPVWGIKPARGLLPAWLEGQPLLKLIEIPNTSARSTGSRPESFGGGAAINTATRAEMVIPAAGGHNDSGDNRVIWINFLDDVPGWSVKIAPSAVQVPDVLYYPADGRPTSRHLYWSAQYNAALDRVLTMGCWFGYGPGTPDAGKLDGIQPTAASTWEWDGVVPGSPGTSGSGHPDLAQWHGAWCTDPLTSTSYVLVESKVLRVHPTTLVQTLLKDFNALPQFAAPACFDPVRNQIVSIGFGSGIDNGLTLNAQRISADGQTRAQIVFTPSTDYTNWVAAHQSQSGIDYDPVADDFLWFCNYDGLGRVYSLKPGPLASDPWTVTLVTIDFSATSWPLNLVGGGVFNRWAYYSALGIFAYVPPFFGENVRAFRRH